MDLVDPLGPRSLDDLVDPVQTRPGYPAYGPVSLYRPYQWEMPRMETPEPERPPYFEPPPEPPPLPTYEDGLLTQGLFDRHMRDLRDQF